MEVVHLIMNDVMQRKKFISLMNPIYRNVKIEIIMKLNHLATTSPVAQ